MRASGGVCILGLALVAGCATPSSQLTDLGGGAYSMTKRSSGLRAPRSDALKAQAELEALALCRDRGQALTMLDSRVVDPDPPENAVATIQFRCVPI
jgi:hypothetical protein